MGKVYGIRAELLIDISKCPYWKGFGQMPRQAYIMQLEHLSGAKFIYIIYDTETGKLLYKYEDEAVEIAKNRGFSDGNIVIDYEESKSTGKKHVFIKHIHIKNTGYAKSMTGVYCSRIIVYNGNNPDEEKEAYRILHSRLEEKCTNGNITVWTTADYNKPWEAIEVGFSKHGGRRIISPNGDVYYISNLEVSLSSEIKRDVAKIKIHSNGAVESIGSVNYFCNYYGKNIRKDAIPDEDEEYNDSWLRQKNIDTLLDSKYLIDKFGGLYINTSATEPLSVVLKNVPEAYKIDQDYGYNEYLREITFGTGVHHIRSGGFCDNDELRKVVIGSDIKTIGKAAFRYCEHLTQIDFSRATSLEVIEDYAFSWHGQIKKLDLSNCTRLKEIGENAFKIVNDAYYDVVDKIVTPSELEYIRDGAFESNNTKVFDMSRSSNIKSIGKEALGDSNIEMLILPERMKELNAESFKFSNIAVLISPVKVDKIVWDYTLDVNIEKIAYTGRSKNTARKIANTFELSFNVLVRVEDL